MTDAPRNTTATSLTTPPKTNECLKAIATEHMLRTKRTEDGELVVRLRGRKQGNWPSDHAHAGMWSETTMYVLVPTTHPTRRAHGALESFPRLIDRSSDSEVLLLGSVEDIVALVTSGPAWCRARKTWRVSEVVKVRLAAHRHEFASATGGTQ